MSDDTAKAGAGARPSSVLYQRPKKTKSSVLFADSFAGWSIRIGGTLVIFAVFTIMLFLLYVASPLLDDGRVEGQKTFAVGAATGATVNAHMDEHQTLVVRMALDGTTDGFHAATGKPIGVPRLDFGGTVASAFARTLVGDDFLFGFPDGTVRAGRIDIHPKVISTQLTPQGLTALDDRDSTDGRIIYTKIPGQFRKTEPLLSLDASVQVAPVGTPIVMADFRVGGTAERPLRTFVTLDATGTIRLSQAYTELNMMTGESAVQLSNAELPFAANVGDVVGLLLNTPGNRVIVAMRDGTIYRFDTRNFSTPVLAETARVVPEGVSITSIVYLNAENSLVVGGSDGSVSIWFGVSRKPSKSTDGVELTKVHGDFEKQPAAITDVRVSQRTRLFSTTDAAGNIWVRHGTTERTLLQLPKTPDTAGLQFTIFAPKDDGILALGQNLKVSLWQLNVPHPETTLQSLFGKVWYEGYSEPQFVWQSTAGTDAAEPKLSLVPLIFGTFKAAIYSLMLAIPIGLLAAAYTSEFLQPRTRAVVKPVMELMATLPSVVIGFVAALVLSPIVENWIAAIVIAFGIIPLTLISASFAWQLLPPKASILLDGVPKIIAFALTIAGAVWLSILSGPLIENTFFAGDFKKWTSGEGSGQPFLVILFLPVSFFVAILVTRPIFNATYRARLRDMSKFAAALRELIGWIVILVLGIGIAVGMSMLLSQIGYDARGGLVDTYVQRNALVVAFAIAFAEIPIIYTISEDALNAVPSYLRSGSLACGASKWQTTKWIVLPTAASGIFSAVMIALGRAVGETMIVVMATGNTPVMDINIFNGLRTLSANINVELPEAVRDSTLYRTLFLCALVLFAMTFVINTIAEIVRQRYRKRSAQL
jgi:phosphate transport system permease protein